MLFNARRLIHLPEILQIILGKSELLKVPSDHRRLRQSNVLTVNDPERDLSARRADLFSAFRPIVFRPEGPILRSPGQIPGLMKMPIDGEIRRINVEEFVAHDYSARGRD